MTVCWSGHETRPRGLRLTGAGSMLGELVKAVLERALEAELTGHPGYGPA
jgi:transposase-like protein